MRRVIFQSSSLLLPLFTVVLLILLLLFPYRCLVANAQERSIEVVISGLNEELERNVRAHLSLIRQQESASSETALRHLFARAEQEIRTALEPFGYYSPEIGQELSLTDTVRQARFHISPGEPVRVTELAIQLTGPGRSERALRRAVGAFPLQRGNVFDHRLYRQGKTDLTSAALAAGYRDVSFHDSTVEVNRDKKSAAIGLVLDTGPQYRFGETLFAADFLNHKLLNRLLPYQQGDPFSSRALIELRQSLLGSDYFSDVEVKSGDASPDSLEIPVLVELSPIKPNIFGFGIGYGTDTGIRGSAEWTNRLLNRYGHQFTLTLQPSERKSSFGGAYTIPVRDPRKDRLSLLAKWEREDFDSTETEVRSVTFSYDHLRERGEYNIYLSYLDESYDTGVDSGQTQLLTPGINVTWRLADSRLRTDRGIRTTFNLNGGHEYAFSDTSFLQGSMDTKAIASFFVNWRFIGRFQFGGTIINDIYELPPSLRFYAGGDRSVRGYPYKNLGPADELGNVIGGRYLLTYSIETERNLGGNWSAALFYDSGNAFNSMSDLEMKNGVGAGVRWNAPFGQIRLDVAKGISEGGSWRIHFNVGADL